MTAKITLAGLACATALLALAGCAPDTLPPTEGSAAVATPTTGGPTSGVPEPDDTIAPGPKRPANETNYECDDGQNLVVHYPDVDHARFHYQGHKRVLHIAMSADGARYVGRHYEWWTRGSGSAEHATLYHRTGGGTGSVITHCHPAP